MTTTEPHNPRPAELPRRLARLLAGTTTAESFLQQITPLELCHIAAPPKAIGVSCTDEHLVVNFDTLARAPTAAELRRYQAKEIELGRPPTTEDFKSDDPNEQPFATKPMRVKFETLRSQALTRIEMRQLGNRLQERTWDAICKAVARIDGREHEPIAQP